MKEEEIIQRLREEAEQNIPDVREKVAAAAREPAPAGEVLVRTRKKGLLFAALALAVLLILSAVLGLALWERGGVGFRIFVSIDQTVAETASVSPVRMSYTVTAAEEPVKDHSIAVEFTLADGKKVSSTRSLNRDSVVLLRGQDFTGNTAEDAILRLAELAAGKHLIGTDGIRLRAEGEDGGALSKVQDALSRLYSVADLDENALSVLLDSYDETQMGDFEDWLTREFDGQEAQFKERVDALLASYEEELAALDTSDRDAVKAFNQKYLTLGDDLIFEDGDEKKSELMEEFAELKDELARHPDRVLDELFEEFIDELEDVYESRTDTRDDDPHSPARPDDEDDEDDDEEDDEDDDD